ncbi:MAG: Ig-like domain-containing protein [Gemmatimonadetes bacterium]|nr:Ig-like domain-containing protein [Gemmatimonadota bacterium]
MSKFARMLLGALLVTGFSVPSAVAQDALQRALRVTRLEATPRTIVVTQGERARLSIAAYDAAGNAVDVPIRIGGRFRGLAIENGEVRGIAAGEYTIFATVVLPPDAGREPPAVQIPVTVEWPTVVRVEIEAEPGTLYDGTALIHRGTGRHGDGSVRPGAEFLWESSDPNVASADRYGYVRANGTGEVTISATFEGVTARITYNVAPFPAAQLEVLGGEDEVRQGDVQTFTAVARDGSGRVIDDLAVEWSLSYKAAEGVVAPSGPGQINGGKVVADVPGVYTAIASAGPLTARRRFTVVEREVVRKLTVVGHGSQNTHYTSDFWVFEGLDGRDYAMTGARQAQSHAFIWDVTDPSNIFKTDSIQVDARSVNDIKVSPDARYAVISREGASNRRNGVVILDMANPAHPTIASIYDEGLTGGVHNVFATNDYLFALSGGDKYVILDMRDIENPTYVSEYNHPNSRIHDLWVHDGIAYSAEWETGVVMVDVGNGRWGGSIENPVLINAYPLPSGRTHAVFPYVSQSTGKFYLFAGDEITNRRGLAWQGSGPDVRMAYDPETGRGGYPRVTSGYIQVIDLTDPENPEMVARYEVTEYGTHNIWVEDDILYQAYYEGGVRLVDVSGELMGNLYTQGREIAVHKAMDPVGWIHNAPAAWSVMPYKGHVFFSDISSGLWSVKLEPKDRPVM